MIAEPEFIGGSTDINPSVCSWLNPTIDPLVDPSVDPSVVPSVVSSILVSVESDDST